METNRVIELGRSVYTLSTEYPEIPSIMAELGFADITKPGMLNTVGRFMTIPKGAKMKGIDLETIKKRFIEKGYTFSNEVQQ